MNKYSYGMRLRYFSIGCQPMQNLIEATEDPTHKYFNILHYSEPLTPEDIQHYSLDDLQKPADIKSILTNVYKSLNKDFLKDLDNYARRETGKPLINLIRSYAQAAAPQPDFIEYLEDLQTNNSISAMSDYYELIDYMWENTRQEATNS